MELELPNKAYMLPEAIPNWPPVWWFWLILLFILGTALYVTYRIGKRYKKRGYRRQAIHILKTEFKQKNSAAKVILCHELIKRSLLSAGRPELASLAMTELIPHLDKTQKKHTFLALGDFFVLAPYAPKIDITENQLSSLYTTTMHWIRTHHD
ncbi:DUF4381 domain-containing protein [Marinomonas mediterranea]|jgi:hypothetical protein|uniref:DUF4381 domain-containing protein n=1 Tax=Marinomonas mediterranea (strain ATCC 700492 / JCM 21426 / NBRC 103028 / MMB-1) TaxID=717774 RepID=F2JWN6_MARM1|nr:DUF4381 domain-containing protein [Marinomonas mediterranea]ADZ91800.1 hypothetical protein Marme_2568 [Marinomonas mediterranea MMB-1]WCN09755.1 DUF4381 family protein [Marinomonas mediterranea]WCN13837.1 DUF4381 family protein [Marinomonas mediterranea]WCN17893.1 DUF4381 family protein [Marinomonas mediterranea MMB-1]